jgi:hypothetical protein
MIYSILLIYFSLGNIKICDVIACHSCEKPTAPLSSLFSLPPIIVIQYIAKGANYKWTAETLEVTGPEGECEALKDRVNEKLGQGEQRLKYSRLVSRSGVINESVNKKTNPLNTYRLNLHVTVTLKEHLQGGTLSVYYT